MLDLPTQTNKKGLGFVTGLSVLTATPPKVQGIPSLVQFVNNGVIHVKSHAMSEDADNDCEMDKWVRPIVLGENLANWFAEDIIEVTRYEE